MKEPIVMQRMSEDSIARVLYYIRAEIIRDGADGVEHADALLRLRGHDPDKYHVPEKMPRRFKGRATRRRSVIQALKQGNATSYEICQRIAAENDDMNADDIWLSVSSCLSQLKKKGVVENDGAWRYPVWAIR